MSKFDLQLHTPIMNAAGMLGFAPDPFGPLELERLGMFVTDPLSLKARSPARGVRYLEYAGGFLLHTGYPNPGLNAALRRFAPRWARSSLPVMVHLLGQSAETLATMVTQLETVEGVAAIELGVPPEAEAELVQRLIEACLGELPLVVRLPLDRAVSLADELAESGLGEALAAVSLAPPRGALPASASNLEWEWAVGRLYGPALFPHALAAVRAVRRIGLPVIGGCGIYTSPQVHAMLGCGAIGVQLDSVLWRGDPPFI